uniref:Ac45-VOA1_TM domain-containing protein n=1 Tax=Panagrellus redivivus TaxID=6233 RepID=A0A7E4V1M0_PANRE
MRLFLSTIALALTVIPSLAEDAVVWSNDKDVSASSATQLASSDNVVILALDDFTLASFSKAANAYSNDASSQHDTSVIAAIRAAKYHASQDVSSISPTTSATVIRAATWDQLNEEFSALELPSGYTGILVNAAILQNPRVKRVSINDNDVDFAADDEAPRPKSKSRARQSSSNSALTAGGSVPVVIPRYGAAETYDLKAGPSCLLYVENITVVVLHSTTIGNVQKALTIPLGSKDGDSYKYGYSCDSVKNFNTTKPFSFTIEYTVGDTYNAVWGKTNAASIQPQTFTVTLSFNSSDGFFLTNAEVSGLSVDAGKEPDFLTEKATVDGSAIHPRAVPLRAYFGYNFACGQTQAIFFNSSVANVLVGVVFDNIQIQASGILATAENQVPQFTRATADCVGTFSAGSWMGIITSIILFSVFMFGYLMLNSVQTMDRFDDPKQKQIVINFKE